MEQRFLPLSAALILALTLAGCAGAGEAGGSSSSAPADASPGTVSSALPESPAVSEPPKETPEPLPPVERRWYPDFTDHLIPGPDYGPLYRFLGPYAGDTPFFFPYAVGLMTADGTVVLDPVLEYAHPCSYFDENGEQVELPVLYLSKFLSTDGEGQMAQVALAARDGSWATGFGYWGCIEFPGGLAVGDDERMSILDPENGRVLRSWTWKELGLSGPMDVAWVTGDAYCTAQYALGAIYLGDADPDFARMLDPKTGAVTEIDSQALIDCFDRRYSNMGWPVEREYDREKQVLTIRADGQEYTFTPPLSGDIHITTPLGDRVFFEGMGDGRFAVTTLEGKVVLPAQAGKVNALFDRGPERLLALQSGDGIQLYDWDGAPMARVPGDEDSWCSLQGPLVEVWEDGCASYYRPDTGECVLRTHWEPKR